jgi:hypothetical protein
MKRFHCLGERASDPLQCFDDIGGGHAAAFFRTRYFDLQLFSNDIPEIGLGDAGTS